MGTAQTNTTSNSSQPTKYNIKILKNIFNISMFLYTYGFEFKDNISYTEDGDYYVITYIDQEIPDLIEQFTELGDDYSSIMGMYVKNLTIESEEVIDTFLDNVAKQYGWGSIKMAPMLSARASAKPVYSDDTDYIKNTKLQANALDQYYFDVWDKANAIKEDVIAGKIPMPTSDMVLSMLPVFDLDTYITKSNKLENSTSGV